MEQKPPRAESILAGSGTYRTSPSAKATTPLMLVADIHAPTIAWVFSAAPAQIPQTATAHSRFLYPSKEMTQVFATTDASPAATVRLLRRPSIPAGGRS